MLESILTKLNGLLPHDKLLHSYYGTTLFMTLLLVSIPFILIGYVTIVTSVIVSFLITVLVAVLKEVYDYKNKDKHTSDIYDILFTLEFPALITLFIVVTLWV